MRFLAPRRGFGFLVLLGCLLFSGAALAQKKAGPAVRIKCTYYDFQGRQLHEEFQYVATATNRFSKHGY